MNDTAMIRSACQVSEKDEQERGVTMVKIALRWSGLALVAAALVLGVALGMQWLWPPGRLPAPLGSTLVLVGSLLLLLALPGMYARQAEATGWLGLVGHMGLAVGNVLFLGFAAAPLFNPSIKGLDAEESVTAGVLALVLLLGYVLTAVATLRASVYPRWAGLLLLAAGVGFLFRFFVADQLPPIAGALIGVSWGVVLAFALVWIGVTLWSGTGQQAT